MSAIKPGDRIRVARHVIDAVGAELNPSEWPGSEISKAYPIGSIHKVQEVHGQGVRAEGIPWTINRANVELIERVRDAEGDEWVRFEDGLWDLAAGADESCSEGRSTLDDIEADFGPLTYPEADEKGEEDVLAKIKPGDWVAFEYYGHPLEGEAWMPDGNGAPFVGDTLIRDFKGRLGYGVTNLRILRPAPELKPWEAIDSIEPGSLVRYDLKSGMTITILWHEGGSLGTSRRYWDEMVDPESWRVLDLSTATVVAGKGAK